ncbi:MAG: Sec-independent protein translocase protein TatC [Candidatus Angelobacter sp.]|jgi:sec-independent protein translocase protein TatC|nr:Sec-independent protein translocase protein TatC [Candidatus Angelobacter sp.]
MPDLLEETPAKSRMDLPGMSLLEHLEELRKRIILSIVGVGVGFLICWHYAEIIYSYVQQPVTRALEANNLPTKLVFLNPTEPFELFIKTGIVAGIFLASPFVLYQVWMFISPGLYRHEKRYVFPFMFSTVLLFLAGGLFGYRMVFPAALTFLIEQGKQFQPMITVSEYTDLFMAVILGLGVVFELPIIIFFLALFGIVDAGFLWRNFRYAILIIFFLAAILTPTTDILNMCIFAAPMVVLYFLSIGIAWFVHPKRRKAKAA